MRKLVHFMAILLIVGNVICTFFLMTQNKNSVYSLYQMTQSRELYTVSQDINHGDYSKNELIEIIKELKVTSSQCWFLYDTYDEGFLIYKDKSNQKIDPNIDAVFQAYANDYDYFIITDEDGSEMLITIRKINVGDRDYIIGVCEYTSVLSATADMDLFNIYVLIETSCLSLLALLLMASKLTAKRAFDKKYKQLQTEFDEYRHRYDDDEFEDEETTVQTTVKREEIICDKDGVFNKALVTELVPKLKEKQLPYYMFRIKDFRIWAIEDLIGEFYKVEDDDDEYVNVLLINPNAEAVETLRKYAEAQVNV